MNVNITCIHLAFVHFLATINVYLNGNLIEENFQLNNLINSINKIIYNFFKNVIDSLYYDVKINNIGMSSDQVSTDYNLFKNNCTYCSATNNKRIFYNSSKIK